MFRAFPKLEMFHTDTVYDDVFEPELPIDSLPESLVSFVVGDSDIVKVTVFSKRLFGGLRCLTVACMSSEQSDFSFLSYCNNLARLTFYHVCHIDFSFLRHLPHLKTLASFSQAGISAEDAVIISRDAPQLDSLTFRMKQMTPESPTLFKNVGRQLRFVKTLMLTGDSRIFTRFLQVFMADHSLFAQVTTLRLLGNTEDPEALDISNELRPQCTVFQVKWDSLDKDFSGKLCDICWERKTSNWMCPRCNTYVFALRS